MMKYSLILVSLIGSLGLGSATAAGETGARTPPVPAHLMSMDRVRNDFGTPDRSLEAVGEPPIARWVYGDYTVYFENDLVLTSVPHRAP